MLLFIMFSSTFFVLPLVGMLLLFLKERAMKKQPLGISEEETKPFAVSLLTNHKVMYYQMEESKEQKKSSFRRVKVRKVKGKAWGRAGPYDILCHINSYCFL